MMIATAGASADSDKQDENPRQAGKSSIYFYDVEATDTHGFGQLKIDVEKRTFVLIGKDFPPSVQIDLQARQVESEDYVIFGSGKTTPSGQLNMSGTFTEASLNYLQEAQLRLTEPGFGSIMLRPRHKYISTGANHSMAVTCDGDVYGWGHQEDCQLGYGDWSTEVHVPILVEPLPPGAVEVVSGDDFNMFLMSGGTVYCVGDDEYGQCGVNLKNDHRCSPEQVHGPGDVGHLSGITRLAAGANFSLAVKEDGSLWAWGRNNYGQLGIGNKDNHTVPYQVHGPGNVGYLTNVVDVAAGDHHTLALKSDGTVWAWGGNSYGQLGIGNKDDHTVPYQVHGPGNVGYLSGIIKVAAGDFFSLAVKEDGSLWAWGGNSNGQLGIGNKDDHTVPYQVHGPGNVGYLTNVVDVAAGRYFSLALRDDGTVWAWGQNSYGQLGIGNKDDHTVPYQVHGPGDVGYLSGIIEVAAGKGWHSLALRNDGTVWAWGHGYSGQLGIGNKDDHTVPYQVHGPGNVGYLTEIGPTCTPLIEMLDQSQPVSQSPQTVSYNTQRAQIFTAGVSGELDRVSLRLQNWISPPSGAELIVSVQTVIGGLPSGKQIGTGSIPLSAIPAYESGGDWVDVDISSFSFATVYADMQYALVLQTNVWNANVDWWYAYEGGTSGSSYTGGEMAYNYGSGWTTDDRYDFTFETYVILY
jgi:alpha-tubulin suppressor-like RCC1 family protein